MDNTRKILQSMMADEAVEAMKNAEKTQLGLVQEGLSMQRNRRRARQFP